jgi:hypothetical protein
MGVPRAQDRRFQLTGHAHVGHEPASPGDQPITAQAGV